MGSCTERYHNLNVSAEQKHSLMSYLLWSKNKSYALEKNDYMIPTLCDKKWLILKKVNCKSKQVCQVVSKL